MSCDRTGSCVGPRLVPTYFGDSAGEERSWLTKIDLIYLKKMGSTANIDKDNIIPTAEEHLPKDVRQLLEELKKKPDEEDLKAVLASIKVDRRGKDTKIKEIDFTSTSTDATEVTPPVSATSTGVTMEQVENLFAEC